MNKMEDDTNEDVDEFSESTRKEVKIDSFQSKQWSTTCNIFKLIIFNVQVHCSCI